MSLPAYEHLLLRLDSSVLTLTLNRPDRLNAISHPMHYELEDFFERIDSMHEARAVIVTGAGRGFCAGGDVSGDIEADPQKRIYGRDAMFGYLPSRGHISRLMHAMVDCGKPLIAAVNGPAAGSGATLALLCDVVLMSESARIGDKHTQMGLTAGDGGTFVWPLLIGLNRAKDLLLSGRMIGAEEAVRLGLANHVVPDAELMDAARNYAVRLAQLPELAVRTTKIACNKVLQFMLMLGGELAVEHYARSAAGSEVERAAGVFQKRGGKPNG